MKSLREAFRRLWGAHAWFRAAFVAAAFIAPWLVLATSSPAWSPIGVIIDLVVLSFVGAAIVCASWEGFSTVGAKVRSVVAGVGIANLAAAEFAFAYWSIAQRNVGAFTEPLDRADAAYLSVATFTTVDVGELAPLSSGARVVATGQMGFGVALLVIGLASVMNANTRRRDA